MVVAGVAVVCGRGVGSVVLVVSLFFADCALAGFSGIRLNAESGLAADCVSCGDGVVVSTGIFAVDEALACITGRPGAVAAACS